MISKIISANNVNSSTSLDGMNFYLWVVTPICLQYSSTGHVEQCDNPPVQICFPNGISKRLMSIHFSFGTFCSNCNIVCSGEADWIKPHRFVTLCTCKSTLIATCLCARVIAQLLVKLYSGCIIAIAVKPFTQFIHPLKFGGCYCRGKDTMLKSGARNQVSFYKRYTQVWTNSGV